MSDKNKATAQKNDQGVLNHVREKVLLFNQIYKVLKSHGLFVIADWLYTQKTGEDLGPLVCETQETYTTFLRQTGFEGIEFRDDSKVFQIYVEHLMSNLSHHRENLVHQYGQEMFDIILKQHQETMAYIQKGQKRPYRIVARKI